MFNERSQDTKECIPYELIYMKFKNRQKAIEVRTAADSDKD